MKPLRIAIVGPAFPYKGGGAHHTTELAHRLVAAGHEVVLESWRAQYPSFLYPGQQTISVPEGEPFPGTRRELSWCRPDGWLRVGRRRGRSCDLVVLVVLSPVQVPPYLGILRGVRSGGRARAVALCHNVLPHERRSHDVRLMRALLRRVHGVLAHSATQGELAGDLAPDTPVRVTALPPHLPGRSRAPEPSISAKPCASARPAAGDKAPRAPRPPATPARRLLFFGIVRPYKGLDVLVRALAAGPGDVSLTIAGEFWGGVDATRALIDELGLSGRVELRPGYVPAAEVPELFARADALVLPYRQATASQNVFMAHEYGVPVIATRAGTLPDGVRDGVDGLLCEPGDVEDLTRTLKRFYAPGEPARLRAGVRPVDAEPYWGAYLDELLTRWPAATW